MEKVNTDNKPVKLEKKKSKSEKQKDATRAIQTYFRNNYRVHTALSALADRKSNIMIKLNSIIISIIIVFFKYITEINPAALIAVISFLVTALFSLIFATIAARPQITNINLSNQDPETMKRNLFFFGNFVHLDKSQYTESFNLMMKRKRLIYENMINDMYFLGKVLDRKFRYIYWSYNIFLIGLIITVAVFLVIFFGKLY